MLAIHTAAKAFTDGSKEKLVGAYKKLVGIAGGVLRKARQTAQAVSDGKNAVVGSIKEQVVATAIVEEIHRYEPLVKQVIAQTKARVFRGDTHFPGKIVSLFEPHTQIIRKGKAHKPTEFGRLIRVDEVDGGIVSNYEVVEGNASDQDSWAPSLTQHEELFGRPPRVATADRGFHSAKNVRLAAERGVKRIALPAKGRASKAQAALQTALVQEGARLAIRGRGSHRHAEAPTGDGPREVQARERLQAVGRVQRHHEQRGVPCSPGR